MTTFSKLRTIPTFEPIESLELLPGVADYVLTMGNAGVIKLWNIESGRLAYTQDESQSVKSSSSSSSSSSTDLEPCIMQSKWIKSANSVVMLTVDESIVFVRVDAALMEKLAKDEQFSLSSDELKRFFNPYKQYIGNHGEILDAKFVDSHERLLAVATNSSDLKIYDLDNWDCKVLKG
jgi:U3 small nucleolar RNA-associated protein 13